MEEDDKEHELQMYIDNSDSDDYASIMLMLYLYHSDNILTIYQYSRM